jgi:hypothetical protein
VGHLLRHSRWFARKNGGIERDRSGVTGEKPDPESTEAAKAPSIALARGRARNLEAVSHEAQDEWSRDANRDIDPGRPAVPVQAVNDGRAGCVPEEPDAHESLT